MDVRSYGVNKLDDEGFNTLEKIINDSELEWNDANILDDKDSKETLDDVTWRKCKNSFLGCPEELNKLFWRNILDYNCNYSDWNYDLEFIESIQLSNYFEGDFYDWHVDSFLHPSIKDNKSYNRKVSATVFLNDPEEYEGGEFDLEVRGPKEKERYDTFKLPKGSIILFPSHFWHRVRPITSGVRKSLVIWIQGPSFR